MTKWEIIHIKKSERVIEMKKISLNVYENLDEINRIFSRPENFDFKIREFTTKVSGKEVAGFLAFYDGLVNQNYMNRDILGGLIKAKGDEKGEISDVIFKRLISLVPLFKNNDFNVLIEMLTFGHCLVFIDGCPDCFVADVKGWDKRSVGEPMREASLSGPQEAFTEIIMNNIALVRKILKDPDLITENIRVGTRSKTPCALMYIKGVTNKKLVEEIRYRLNNIDTEYIFSSGDIEMLLETKTYFPMTYTLKTERPDRAASMLAEGKVVVIVQGSPFALVLPTTAADLIETSEDNYVRVPEANFMRIVRLLGMTLSVLLPGFFVAIMLYHREVFPTDLLLNIEASREVVPFPLVLELILMELAFELIKEASVRVPSPIGSTLGIIGGLILGQAAVDANIVSPISIIIVSIAGLGAFATPSVELSRSMALTRFVYIIFAAIGGFLGLIISIFATISFMAASSTFGVPFLSPITPRDENSAVDVLLIKPIWKKEKRPQNLNTQNPRKQPHISRKWLGKV